MYSRTLLSLTSTEGNAHAFSLSHKEWRENPPSLSNEGECRLTFTLSHSYTLTHRLSLSHSQNEGHANFHSQTDTQSGGYTCSRTLAHSLTQSAGKAHSHSLTHNGGNTQPAFHALIRVIRPYSWLYYRVFLTFPASPSILKKSKYFCASNTFFFSKLGVRVIEKYMPNCP